MQLIVWLLVSGSVIGLARRRPSLWVIFAFLIYAGVPSVARSVFVGSLPLHPGTIFVFLAVLYMITVRPHGTLRAIAAVVGPLFLLVTLICHAVVLTVAGTGAIGLLANTLVGPMCLLLLTIFAFAEEGPFAKRLITSFSLVFSCAQAVLSFIQVTLRRTIFYEEYYTRFYWFKADRFSRGLGTLDSPLDLALLLVVALPLCIVVHQTWLRLLTATILMMGLLTTQSRLGVVLGGIALVYIVGKASSLKGRVLGALGMFVAGVAVFSSTLGQSFLMRAENASGSTSRRLEALNFILENISRNALIGDGLNASFGLRQSSILGSSLENGFAMFAFDFGWIPAALFLILILGVIVAGLRARLDSVPMILVLAVIMIAGYSSIMTQSASAAILFLVLGLAMGEKEAVTTSKRSSTGGQQPASKG